MTNQLMVDDMGQVELEHLSRTGSDHAPLLLSCRPKTEQIHKSFRLLNFWTKKEDFKELVRQN